MAHNLAAALLVSNGLPVSEDRAVYRFNARPDSIELRDTLRAYTVDSVRLALNLLARDTLVDGLKLYLYRIDPATGTLAATIPLGEAEGGAVKVSTGAGAVWVTTAGGASYAIDPADNTVAGEADSMGTLGLFFPES